MLLLCPIETQGRELDYKLIIAHYCAAKFSTRSYVGSTPIINSNVHSFRNGIYFGKTVFTKSTEIENKSQYEKIRSFGFDIAYLHEEGAIWNGKESDWSDVLNKMYDLSIFNSSDMVMLWGEWQKRIEEERNHKNIPLYVTGSPRFDLLKDYGFIYEGGVNELKGLYGDYILISGKYTLSNHGESFHKATSDLLRWEKDFEQNLKDFYGLTVYTAHLMFEMVNLVANLAMDFPHLNFIFRPHPSEKLETYNDLFSRLENVRVVREGSANKYIMGAKVLIHDGCTTAVEASTAGIPIINYKKASSELDTYVPSHIGKEASSIDEVKRHLAHILNDNEASKYNVEDQLAKDLLHNLTGNSSFEIIFKLFENYFKGRNEPSSYPKDSYLNSWYYKTYAKIGLSNFKNTLIGRKDKVFRNKYLTDKFPGITKNEIEAKVQQLNSRLDTQVQLHFINPHIFYLEG